MDKETVEFINSAGDKFRRQWATMTAEALLENARALVLLIENVYTDEELLKSGWKGEASISSSGEPSRPTEDAAIRRFRTGALEKNGERAMRRAFVAIEDAVESFRKVVDQ